MINFIQLFWKQIKPDLFLFQRYPLFPADAHLNCEISKVAETIEKPLSDM